MNDAIQRLNDLMVNPVVGTKVFLGIYVPGTSPEKICYVWDGEKWVKASGDDCRMDK